MSILQSFPSRGRGLKSYDGFQATLHQGVVPLAGTWIEILMEVQLRILAGSFPSRGRGLKYSEKLCIRSFSWLVVPLAGTWIEI